MATEETGSTPFSRQELLAFCGAVASIIAADRKITDEERAHLAELISDIGLSIDDPEVQRAVYDQLSKPQPIEKVVSAIEHPVLRRSLYRTLIEVAVSDGLVAQEEDELAKLAVIFKLNPDAARDLVRWTVDSIALEKREDEILKRL
jgi:uncharacterized membrane protein YebE (DUF533 family)